MKLIYINEELDSSLEREFFSDNEFGFNVVVTYKTDSWMSKYEGRQVVSIFNNCTEVHNRFTSLIKDKPQIAFESDIHSTGCTRKLEDIESVSISIAIEKEEHF